MRSFERLLFVSMLCVLFSALGIAQTPTPTADKIPPKSTSKVNVKYDKSKDTTSIALKSMTITRSDQERQNPNMLPAHQMEFDSSFSYKGQFPGEPVKEVTLRFRCVADNYIFLRGQELIVAIDREIPGKDRGFSLGITSYKSLTPKFNTVYEEVMDIKVPADAISKFVDAKTLEFFFGPIIYKLTPKQQDAIKEFKAFLPGNAPSR